MFAAALAYFLYSYFATFAVVTVGGSWLPPTLVNVALFGLFGLHHSLFARRVVRDAVARRIPASLERSVYVWVASVLLIAVCAFWQNVPGRAWQLDGAWRGFAVAAQLLGFWLTVRSAAIINAWDLAGVRQVSTGSHGRDAASVGDFRTDGPYGWVRHPIYLGWILIVFGVWTMTGTRLVFALVSSVYILVAIPLEERTLRATSADAYGRYMRRVPWKLVPRLY